MKSTCSHLIEETAKISKRAKEISKLKGENFNIFKVLNVEYNEVATHNRFIAELLNPKGSHELGDRFLKLFINHIEQNIALSEVKQKVLEGIREADTYVKAEYWLGKKNHKNISGGCIDICIKSSNGQIRIENKIHASEQDNQVARYCFNHEQDDNIVFYLTLNGKDSKTAGKFKKGVDYFLLSHEENILSWLETCHAETADQPILRETLKQYIILIRKLTGQTTSKKMDEEIETLILKNSKNFEATEKLSTSYERAIRNEYKRIVKIFETRLKAKHGLPFQKERSTQKDSGFIPLKTLEINNKNYDLGINIELSNNYCFFCMVQVGGNRNPKINTNTRFDQVALELTRVSKEFGFSGSRNGWRLTGLYYFKNKFNFKNYLDNNRDKDTINAIYDEIDEIIEAFQKK